MPKATYSSALLGLLGLSLLGCAETQQSGPDPQATPDATAAIIVDHTSTRLDRVPIEWVAQARLRLRIAYGHTSHGSQLITGIQSFRGAEGSTHYFTSSSGSRAGVFLNDSYPSADLGSSGDTSWRDRTVQMLGRSDNDRNVVMWSWCGGVSSSSAAHIDAYLSAMDELERSYPAVRFVYMTGHLDGSGSSGTLHQRNEQIRAFCRSRRKVLFDFADIEGYDPDAAKDYMSLLADDNCDYDGNADGRRDRNWALDWVATHPDHELARTSASCAHCAHSQKLNCVLKGRAFWWLMARLAGWSGA